MDLTKPLLVGMCSSVVAGAAAAEDPIDQPDETWIDLSGTVVAPDADSFTLDYGQGVVVVEMDDWDNYGDAYGLIDGDKVTVYGRVDDDLFERATIEASSVYVENLNTYFYASSADEEDFESYITNVPIETGRTNLRGEVVSVDRFERQFTIDAGTRVVTVDTTTLGYNPLDSMGYQKIEVGDRVSVAGDMDYDFIEGRELEADLVITLDKDPS